MLTIVEHLTTSPFEPVLHRLGRRIEIGYRDGYILMVTDGHCALYLTMCPLEFYLGFWADVVLSDNLGDTSDYFALGKPGCVSQFSYLF